MNTLGFRSIVFDIDDTIPTWNKLAGEFYSSLFIIPKRKIVEAIDQLSTNIDIKEIAVDNLDINHKFLNCFHSVDRYWLVEKNDKSEMFFAYQAPRFSDFIEIRYGVKEDKISSNCALLDCLIHYWIGIDEKDIIEKNLIYDQYVCAISGFNNNLKYVEDLEDSY